MSSLLDSILSSGLPLPSLGGHANWHCHLAPLLGGLVNWDCHYHHWAQWAAPSTGTANTTTPTGTATTIIGRPRQLPLPSLGVPVDWHCHYRHIIAGRPRQLALHAITGQPRQLALPLPSLSGPVNWDHQYHHASWGPPLIVSSASLA